MDILELIFQNIQSWRIIFVFKLVNQDAFYLIEFNFKNVHRKFSSKYLKMQIYLQINSFMLSNDSNNDKLKTF